MGRYFCNLYKFEIIGDAINGGILRYNDMKRILFTLALACSVSVLCHAQERLVQNKPYVDLRPFHFGILVGMNMQDMEFENVGPQTITAEDGTTSTQTILCDADTWNPGITVGIVGEMRLSQYFALRTTPAMHFGAKHLSFRNLTQLDENGRPNTATQDLKNTYISVPVDLKISAQRFNNYRPYIIAGVNQMINLTGKDQDYIRLKRTDTMLEVGLGCDLYLPFFKLIPELKFCYSLTNSLDTNHADELQDASMKAYAKSVSRGQNKMIVLTFYFE